MKQYYIVTALSTLVLASCGTQKKVTNTQATAPLYLPATELPATSVTVKQDSLMDVFLPESPKHEVRAVWLTTLGGLDWPTTKANTPERILRQKEELITILDKYKAAGINTVLFQTRVRGSVIYPSEIEPWDLGLTGQYGKDPGYDPLKFAIDECHKRGMELQAWLVAIPLGKVTLNKGYGKAAVTQKQKALCVRSGDEWFMDPGNPQVPAYLASIAKEIVTHYDVDGINLDYIRYPEEPHLLNDTKSYRKYGKGMSLSDWRRQNITNCVKAIYNVVKSCKPWVKVSSSPVGKYQDLPRYSSFGWNSIDKVYQETEKWFEDGIHDEIFPMMYFDGRHFYPFASDWQENSKGRIVVPGLGIYFLDKALKDWPLDVISRQIGVVRTLHMGGQAYFRSRFFTNNIKGIYDYAQERLYPAPALQPPMNWVNLPAPPSPQSLSIDMLKDGNRLIRWNAPHIKGSYPIHYTVYASDRFPVDVADPHNILQTGVTSTFYVDSTFLSDDQHRYFAITTVDGFGKESQPLPATLPHFSGSNEWEYRDNCLIVPSPFINTAQSEWIILSDAYGRQVAKSKATPYIDISSLTTGYYRLSLTDDKTSSLRDIGYFFK